MIIIKRVKDILFFSLLILTIIYLLNLLGVIKFFLGILKTIFPLIIAFFISICMESMISRFIKKGYGRKKVTIIAYVLLVIIVSAILVIFIPLFIKQIKIFIEALPTLLEKLKGLLAKLNININSNNFLDSLQIRIDKIIEYFSEGFSFIIDIGVAFSAAFFISYDYDKIKEAIKGRIPKIIKKETIYFFSKYLPFFSKYIYSLLIDSVITFIISFALFALFKVKYSLIGALIITITNLIPFIGPLLGIIPLVIFGYSVSAYFAIISLVVVLLVQVVESNFIQPIIFNNVIKLHPVEGILGVLIFSYMFGAIGMIFSPLLVVAFKILFIDKYENAQVTL